MQTVATPKHLESEFVNDHLGRYCSLACDWCFTLMVCARLLFRVSFGVYFGIMKHFFVDEWESRASQG